ncbi:MAG: AAA family ATPase [Candidatus Latescibacteria bacterium]|nr:AAA family ATPase [Candidatus Latescibacterota bacterium]
MPNPVFLKRVVLKNYKSVAACSVELGPLTFLVGPNGAGKSNFLDAMRLVNEAITASLDHALRDRGGINEVRRRSSGHPTHFGIRLEFQLPGDVEGFYAFRVGAQHNGGFEVQHEECHIRRSLLEPESYFIVKSGQVADSSLELAPPGSSDRLYLVAAAGQAAFRPLYDALAHMGFYNLNPDEIRKWQPPDPGIVLRRDGSNLAGVLSLVERERSSAHTRVVEFLSKVVPGVNSVSVRHAGKNETLEFRQEVGTNKVPWRFTAENMSDGTLRALGVLTALFQSSNGEPSPVPLVGIEEPEAAVHPGAAGVLRDGLKAASASTQVLVTSHSPDLLDDKSVDAEWILGVTNVNGETKIGPIDEAGRSAIRDRLYTAGELLRQGQLEPDLQKIERTNPKQLSLFTKCSRRWSEACPMSPS